MGYESTLVIVRPPNLNEDGEPDLIYPDGEVYCRLIGNVELYKAGQNAARIIANAIGDETERVKRDGWSYSFYGYGDGDHPIIRDCYGDPVAPLPVPELIAALELDQAAWVSSAPFDLGAIALAMLKSLPVGGDYVVLHYGH